MDTLDLLIRGRCRIARGLSRGSYAKNADGVPVLPNDSGAASWCALGAVNYSLGNQTEALDLLLAVGTIKNPLDIARWSDEASQEEVLALYDAAIARYHQSKCP